MSLQASGQIYWPDPLSMVPWFVNASYPVFSTSANYDLNSTNTKQAVFMPVPRSGNITGVAFTLQGVTTADEIQVSIQTLASNGDPSGSMYKGSTGGTIAGGSLVANAVLDVPLGTQAASAAAGDWVAVVFDRGSSTVNAKLAGPQAGFGGGLCYEARYSGSTWSTRYQNRVSVGFRYDDGSYGGGVPLISTTATRAYNASTASADEYGLKIPVPFKCRCVGAWYSGMFSSATTNLALLLYDGTTNLAKAVIDPDAASLGNGNIGLAYFDASQTLSPGRNYYLSLSSESTSINVNLYCPQVPSNAHLSSWPGGAGVFQVKRLDAVTWSGGLPSSFAATPWTEVNTEYTTLGLIIDRLDNGSGGVPQIGSCFIGV